MFSLIVFGVMTLIGCGEGEKKVVQAENQPAQAKAATKTTYDGSKALGAPFVDNMILQRGMKVPVWGWTQPGTEVKVEFAGKSATATAGSDGKWMAYLPSLEASFEPREMMISAGEEKTTLKNILVGEVWMASGQSNMQWKVGKCNVLAVAASLKAEMEKDGLKVAPIREFEITSVFAMLHPIEKATGSWKDGNYNDYSAIAFAFAHKIYKELKVPVGILNCSFSQTPIEAWVPRIGYRDGKDDYAKGIYQKVLETDPNTPEHKKAWSDFYKGIEAEMEAVSAKVAKGEVPGPIKPEIPGNMKSNRDATWLYHGRLHAVVPFAIKGTIWNQGYANMGKGYSYYSNLHSLVRGWRTVWDQPDLPVYFNQFYSAGMKNSKDNPDSKPTIGGSTEMKLGTWMARDIPGTGMASQIDISGAIHYRAKTVPGQRLALHALKNQYGQKDLVVDGPMYKSYSVEGDKLIVEFEHAEGGLVVGETGTERFKKGGSSIANPTLMENADEKVKLFYLADENRVWYPASMKVEGSKVILTSPKVKAPRGVSYASSGVGWQPNLYNKALLPATPFIFYDNKMVLKKDWPEEKLKVDGIEIDPNSIGKVYQYRKMPILSTQFRDKAVLQAGKPVTIWGSAIHDWGFEAEGEAVINFSFGEIKKTIPVTSGMKEWNVTLPAMKAGNTPYTLKVTFTIDGELVHERVAEGIVFGDVWYIGAPGLPGKEKWKAPEVKPSGQIVRMIQRQAKRSSHSSPSRYSVAVSTTPKNRFASHWKDAEGLSGILGHRLAAKSGTPVGIIWMQSVASKGKGNPELKSWIPPKALNKTPSLMEDYKIIGSQYPSNPYYLENIKRYLNDWKTYWGEYIPEMMSTKKVPDGVTWGSYPSTVPDAKSSATLTYNVLVKSFTPVSLKGAIFISADSMGGEGQRATFGPELSVLGNALREDFGDEEIPFIYTQPSEKLAPGITKPEKLKGTSKAVEINSWADVTSLIEVVEAQ